MLELFKKNRRIEPSKNPHCQRKFEADSGARLLLKFAVDIGVGRFFDAVPVGEF